jgi:BCCT family betaine/carnitine transporter
MAELYSSEYEVGEDNIQVWGLDIHNPVFMVSSCLIIAFVIATLLFPDHANQMLADVRTWSLSTFDSSVMIAVNLILLFSLALILLPVGAHRVGGATARPAFRRRSWVSMWFAAGMGIGRMLWGGAEPMAYFTGWAGTPLNVEAWSEDAVGLAMGATVYHWGLHAWAIYAVVGLALAFFNFNCGLPLTLRSAFYPLLGERCWGWQGHVIDTFAVLATIFGLATSLGLGASQVNAGFTMLFDIDDALNVKLSIIVLVTFIAIFSVVRGLDGGVKFLSNINMVIAGLLLLFIAVVGSISSLGGWIFSTTGHYLSNIIPLSNWTGRDDTQWMRDWTVFYWAWWVSWSPFVGLFIARISKGRTVREFLLAVLFIPTIVTILWMSVFGMNAIEQAQAGVGSLAGGISSASLATFQMLENLPFSSVTTVIGIFLVLIFFITSSDSGSLVIDSITAGGKLDAPTPQRIFWVVIGGLIASVLLYGGGKDALSALQAGTVATGVPFTLVLLFICASLYKGLTQSLKEEKAKLTEMIKD